MYRNNRWNIVGLFQTQYIGAYIENRIRCKLMIRQLQSP
jgi:hypothetical protein